MNTKTGVIWTKRHFCIWFRGCRHFCNCRWINGVEIVSKLLDVFQSSHMVDRFDTTIFRPNEDEFNSKPVFSTDNLFFFFVVVCRCSQVTENHFWNPNTVFGMFCHINTVSVIRHCDHTIFGDLCVNISNELFFEIIGLYHTNYVVTTVDDTLIEQFVEAGNVFYITQNNLFRNIVEYPHIGIYILNGTDIGVGIIENVLFVGFLLVLGSKIGRHLFK